MIRCGSKSIHRSNLALPDFVFYPNDKQISTCSLVSFDWKKVQLQNASSKNKYLGLNLGLLSGEALRRMNIPLADRMKLHEAGFDETFPSDEHVVIRLDMRNASTYTRHFPTPWTVFAIAMIQTMNHIVEKLNPVMAHCVSDEMTFIWPAGSMDTFSNRILKYLSLVPAEASGFFNCAIRKLMREVVDPSSDSFSKLYHNDTFQQIGVSRLELVKKIVENTIVSFDARPLVFTKDQEWELVNHSIWRSCVDGSRNMASTYAHLILGKKNLKGVSTRDSIAKMKQHPDNPFDWDKTPLWLRYGVYAKKVPFTNAAGSVGRRVENRSLCLKCSTNVLAGFLSNEWWPIPTVESGLTKIVSLTTSDSLSPAAISILPNNSTEVEIIQLNVPIRSQVQSSA
jgi:tRNA(His) 5'-end guanylyltransferase